jgi:hypothetical protein
MWRTADRASGATDRAGARGAFHRGAIARAKSLELPTPYEPVPGNPLEHHTSGYAKTMCSAVFITGLDPEVAAESVGYFTGPYAERKKVGKPVVDRAKKEVRISIPDGPTLTARYYGSQGCITLPPAGTTSSTSRSV